MSKQKIFGIAVILILILAGVVYGVSSTFKKEESTKIANEEDVNQDVVLSLEYDEEVKEGLEDEIIVPARLSYLPSGVFSSASMSIEFDKEKLEFVGINKGTIEDYSNQVPEWSFDADASNERGVVNTIYLDKTGAKNSYYKSGFEKDKKDIVLYLVFKLKDDAKSSDILHLNISDAVFATVNGDTDNSNLSTAKNTMKNKNLMIEVK